jgi:hypothetical protein
MARRNEEGLEDGDSFGIGGSENGTAMAFRGKKNNGAEWNGERERERERERE